MRVIAMDAAGALGFAFVLILFTIMGALTYDPLLFAVIPLLAVRRSAPVVALFGATILPGAQFMTNPLAFDLPLYGSALFMTFSVAAFAVRRVRWMCAAPPLLAIALLGIQLVAPNTDLPPWGADPAFQPRLARAVTHRRRHDCPRIHGGVRARAAAARADCRTVSCA